MATALPSEILSVPFAATASGRNESCLVSLVHRPAKPRSSAARATWSTPGRCLPSTARPASSFIVPSLRDQDQLPGGLAAFQVAVGLLGLGEAVGTPPANAPRRLPE